MISLPGQVPSAANMGARLAIVELLNCHKYFFVQLVQL